MKSIRIFFIINLIQDLNIIRPLAYLIKDDLNINISFLITEGFNNRDKGKSYLKEINKISNDIEADIFYVKKPYMLFNYLNSCKRGIIISSSESCLYAHIETNQIFTACGDHLIRITLQHGFECVGFLNNINHTKTYGKRISFSADIICGWLPQEYQRELMPDSRNRYYFTGPTIFIEETSKRDLSKKFKNKNIAQDTGIICENIHSVRFAEEGSENRFVHDFFELSNFLKNKNMNLTLRPHPGGYLKKSITKTHKLPKNVSLEVRPSYQVDWSAYAYGISAPSSVLFDMFFSGIPVALWSDLNSNVDTSLLSSFYMPKSLNALCQFALNPIKFKEIKKSGSIIELTEVKLRTRGNFIRLISSLID